MRPSFNFTNAQYSTTIDYKPYAQRLEHEVNSHLLPFLTLPFFENLCEDIEKLRPFFSKFKHMLVLGIGGSALGARALQKAFAPGQDRPMHKGKSLWIMDNIDPDCFSDTLNSLPKEETIVVTISKSGTTIETIAQYFIVRDLYKSLLPESWQNHFIHVTDRHNGFLREEAHTYSIRTLDVPDNLGGRYSALSAVGMLPAAFLDIDYKMLMQGAADIGRKLVKDYSKLAENEAWKIATWAYELIEKNYSQLIFFVYHPAWATFGAWFSQLWAESLGKNGKGSMPIPALGVTDQHSLLQMFLDGQKDKGCIFLSSKVNNDIALLPNNLSDAWKFLENKPLGEILEAETLATRMALVENKVPLVHAHFPTASCYEAGQFMLYMELATILTGWLLNINPIDQPAVEQGKVLANAKLGSPAYLQYLEKLNNFKE